MSTLLHLEGMGLMGSLIARLCVELRIPFTWSDTDASVSAWQACTGCVYPSGDASSNDCLARWADEWALKRPLHYFLEPARWVYYSKHPPHGGRYQSERMYPGSLQSAVDTGSMHLNAQYLVRDTQHRLRGGRVDEGTAPYRLITHGFGTRLHHWSWGWSAQVEVRWNEVLEALFTEPAPQQRRMALYLRDGMVMDYLYPVPGSPYWYAGSSLINQTRPARKDAEQFFERWRKRVLRKAEGVVESITLTRAGALNAWRPVPASETEPLLQEQSPGVWALRPQYGAAIRHWWTTRDALIPWLNTLMNGRAP